MEEPVRQPEEKPIREATRRKKSTPADYREIYFQKIELPDRQPIYVSRSTHEKLMKIVRVIGERKSTVSSYVETIILHHFAIILFVMIELSLMIEVKNPTINFLLFVVWPPWH